MTLSDHDRRQQILTLLNSPAVAAFIRRHAEVESAPRWVCPSCQFEQNEHYASHAPGCSHVRVAPRSAP